MTQLEEFGLALKSPLYTTTSKSYRPPYWPPPRDWVVIEDAQGKPVSRWGDPIWRLDPWAGKSMSLNFGDGPVSNTTPIDPNNADLLRLMVTYRIWGPHGVKVVNSLVSNFFSPIRAIVALCSREGILASDLMRYPAVRDKVANVIAPSQFKSTIAELQRVLDARHTLGFTLLDQHGLKRLAAAKPDHQIEQTAYIPPRIWVYQVNRLRECLEDFLSHQQQIEHCFQFCLDAYTQNYGSLKTALTTKSISSRTPFRPLPRKDAGKKIGCVYYGHFMNTATQFGLYELFTKWIEPSSKGQEQKGIRFFTSYLTLVANAGLAYISNFSLMRIEEAASLRADCLYWEKDDKFGNIPILCGETTKTEQDSDARWPTSPSVQIAIDAMSIVARLRMRCAKENPVVAPSAFDEANPYLYDRAYEPWAGNVTRPYSLRKHTSSYADLIERYPKLFDENILKITEDDLKIARLINPALDPDMFQVGMLWLLAWHQLRRTGAVNMFASGVVSDASMQYLMKHASRMMPLYYGQGHSRLCINEETRVMVVNAMYEVMGKEILNVLSDRFVSPYGEDRKNMIVVNLITEPDAKRFSSLARKGEIFFRTMRLGGCVKRGTCSYGGVESISHCSGGDDDHPCVDVLYDREAAEENKKALDSIIRRLETAHPDSPLYRSLKAEKHGLENYFNVISQH